MLPRVRFMQHEFQYNLNYALQYNFNIIILWYFQSGKYEYDVGN
jgi:hypothetical protein